MKTMFSAKAILVLATTPLLSAGSIFAQTLGEQKTLTGVVNDAMCDQSHMLKDKPDAECLRYRAEEENKYALVAGKSVYTPEGHEAELHKYTAQNVTVRGTLKVRM